MDLVSGSIIALWGASIPIRMFSAARVGGERIAHRYPFLCAWLVGSAIHSAWLMYVWKSGGNRAYAIAISESLALAAAANCILALEGFWSIVRDFRHITVTAVVTLALFVVVGMIATTASFDVLVPAWDFARAPYLLIRRHFGVFCLVFTLLARWLFSDGLGPVSRNALTYNTALLLYFGGEAIGHGIMRASAGSFWVGAAGQYVLQAGMMAGYLWWAGLRRVGEDMRIDENAPESLDQGFRTLLSLRREFYDALKSLFSLFG